MSPRIPSLTAKKVLKALSKKKTGLFICHEASSGGHIHLCHPLDSSILVIIPMHSRELPRGTLMSIIKQAKLTQEEFLELL